MSDDVWTGNEVASTGWDPLPGADGGWRTSRSQFDPLPTVEGGWRTILADPAWEYGDSLSGPGRGAGKHYDCLSVEAICALPVDEAAAARAHLYVCVTNAHIEDGYRVVRAWGFEPKTLITWVKTARDHSVRLGMGRYLRNATEQVIVAARGRPMLQPLVRNRHNVIFAPRAEHSAKPDELYELVEAVSPGPRLELFSRRRREGWQGWGREHPAG